ncbi:MAG: TetR/AcrR family transcriptional regulator [Actinomycetia bacterium]|nr:TetR/AcrR family transcriptional regulator [Actinomycetes bacterium]
MDLDDGAVGRRRRGAELEAALLDAAWDELVESDYGALTIDAVARRAGTSRTVIYRRWATKQELVRAAVAHVARRYPRPDPDTGSLREDMLEVLRYANESRSDLGAMLVVHLGGYLLETGTAPADLREFIVGDPPNTVDLIIDRAIERGEVDADRLTPRRRSLAFDLFRNEVLMTLKAVPDETLIEIVDDVYLPLVTGRQSAETG